MVCSAMCLDGGTYDQTQEIIENWNCFGNDPCKDPENQANCNPGADRKKTALVHPVGSAEHADVDVLHGNVAVDDTGDDDLGAL